LIFEGGQKMRIKEIIPPEQENWITQEALYAYNDCVRLGSLFVENIGAGEEIEAIYEYEIDGHINLLPNECETWNEAVEEFLRVMEDYFSDQEKYYRELQDMIENLMNKKETT
jgi:hypothetical protein